MMYLSCRLLREYILYLIKRSQYNDFSWLLIFLIVGPFLCFVYLLFAMGSKAESSISFLVVLATSIASEDVLVLKALSIQADGFLALMIMVLMYGLNLQSLDIITPRSLTIWCS